MRVSIFFLPVQSRGGYFPLGHRFLLKSSTRDCATGPAIQFRRSPIRRGVSGEGYGRCEDERAKESWSLSSESRTSAYARRASHIPLLPNSGFFSDSLSLSLPLPPRKRGAQSNSEDYRSSQTPSDLPGFYPIRSGFPYAGIRMPKSERGRRASERPAAALAAFFARCEIARVLRGVSRARMFLRVYSSLPFLLLPFLPRVSADVRVWVAGRATLPIVSVFMIIGAPARPRVRALGNTERKRRRMLKRLRSIRGIKRKKCVVVVESWMDRLGVNSDFLFVILIIIIFLHYLFSRMLLAG